MFEKSLLDELLKFSKKDAVRAHMPGHNGGAGLSSKLRHNAFRIDVTEFDGTDNLQNPQGILRAAQERAAKAFGAKRTFFLVNGSTVGIQAAVLAATTPGSKLIVDRCCHKSVIAAMILAGVEPVFIEPDFASAFGIYGAVQPLSVMDAMHDNPDAAGVVITSPNYYGVCADIERLAQHIHSAGMFLLVDEAHGAHFAFSDDLPKPALKQGADMVVQSAHKMLPALGQTALLHIGDSDFVSGGRVGKFVNILQTSSPSYMLLASLDEAIHGMRSDKSGSLNKLIDKIVEIKSKIGVLDNVSCVVKSNLENDYDIMKMVVDFSSLGITGYGAAELLRHDYGIYPEMADERNVLFYFTAGTTLKDLDKIDRAITDISKTEFKPQPLKKTPPLPQIKMAKRLGWAFYAETEIIDAGAAIGRVCAEIVNCCPPCVPIAVPGQLITNAVVEYINNYTEIETIEVIA